MEMDALNAFVTVVRCGSFTKAAVVLGTQKSTLSRIVSRLEDKLNVRLLQRSTRSLQMTESGRELYERASTILEALEETSAAMERSQETPRGALKLTCGVEFGIQVVNKWISAFASLYPDVTISVELTNRSTDIIHEGFDLAIRVGVLSDSCLSARMLGQIEYGLVASPAYLAKHGVPASPVELAHHRIIAFVPFGNPVWRLVNGCEQFDFRPKPGIVVNSSLVALTLAEDGHGITHGPLFQTAARVKAGDLVRILPPWAQAPIPVHALFASSRYLSPKVRAFVDLARAEFARDPVLGLRHLQAHDVLPAIILCNG